MLTPEQREFLGDLANKLRITYRFGETVDSPEGVRYIMISDTLAKNIEERLREISDASL